jgi:outer membrane protein assembly factor BamB
MTHPAPSSTSKNRKRRLLAPVTLATAAVTGIGAVCTGALFTDTKTLANNQFSAGTVVLDTDPSSTVFNLSGMAPGDTVTEPVTVRNDGTLQFRYAMESVATGDLAPALTLQVKVGVTDCSNTGFGAEGTNLYGASAPAGTADGMKVFGDKAQGQDPGDRTLAAGTSEVLCVQMALPSSTTDNDYQDQTAQVSFNFYAEQTANNGDFTATNSETGSTDTGATPTAPSGFSITVAGTSGYTLSWTDPDGVAGVYVYRSNDGGTTWTKVADVAAPTTTWTDTDPGTTPTYTLVSYDSSGTTSGTPGGDGSVGSTTTPPALPASGTTSTVATGLGKALGVAYGADGYVYVGNYAGDLYKVDPSTGTKTTVTTGLGYEYGVTYGAGGYVYVTNSTSDLYKVDPSTGTKTTVTTGLGNAFGVAYGADGYVYVGNYAGRLYKVDPSTGTKTTVATGLGDAEGVAYGADGYVYVTDPATGDLYKVDPSTGTKTTIATNIGSAAGVTYGADGYLYVGNQGGYLYKVDPATSTRTAVTSGLGSAVGVAYGADGYIYVTDLATGDLYKVVP